MTPRRGSLRGMPRWLLALLVAALTLAVIGSVLVFLRATPAPEGSTATGSTRAPATRASPSPGGDAGGGATAPVPRTGGGTGP